MWPRSKGCSLLSSCEASEGTGDLKREWKTSAPQTASDKLGISLAFVVLYGSCSGKIPKPKKQKWKRSRSKVTTMSIYNRKNYVNTMDLKLKKLLQSQFLSSVEYPRYPKFIYLDSCMAEDGSTLNYNQSYWINIFIVETEKRNKDPYLCFH